MKKTLLGGAVTLLVATTEALAIPPPVPLPMVKGNQLEPEGPIVFVAGSDQLTTVSEQVLLTVREYLFRNPDVTLLRIEGHTDGEGGPANNQRLSERRALIVARWMIDNGIDCKRLIAVGFGATRPIADSRSPGGREKNRRIVFANVALQGRVLEGLPPHGGGKIAGDLCSGDSPDPKQRHVERAAPAGASSPGQGSR